MEKVLLWIILLFLFFVLPNILQALAKRQAQKRAQGAPPPADEDAEAEAEDTVHQAEASDIERYLESIGIKVERRPPPAPPRRQPVPQPQPAPVRVVVRQAPPPPPRPQRPPRPAPQPAAIASLQPIETTEQPATADTATLLRKPTRPTIAALGQRPLTLQDFRRGIILSEILRRPDFDQLPCDRLLEVEGR